MAASAADFLQSFETQTAQRAAVERETHTEVSERLRDRDLLGLMSIHSSVGFPFEEDPLGILPLVPETFNSSSASYIENLGGDAASCADQCRQFGSSAEETLTNLFHMCNEDSLADLRVNLRRQLSHERAAVQKTQTAIARVQNKSLTEALGHYLGECNLSWVNEDEKGAKYDEMQSELHDSHVKSTREAALRLLESSTLPFPHDAIHAQQKDAESLQQKADGLPSWRRAVTEARARLAEQQADTRVKRQRCASLRRISRREVAAKRQALEQAEKTRQRTWQEYLDAYIRDEAVFMTEDNLQKTDEAVTEALSAADAALQEANPKFARCEQEAASCMHLVHTRIQETHAGLLDYSKPAVEAAWTNTAFARELGKCALAAKQKEVKHLCKEQQQRQEAADAEKQPKSKAELLEEVQQLGRQIAERQEAALELESLVARAEVQFETFSDLNSGLDADAIHRFAQEEAAACYGDFELFVSANAARAPLASSEAIQQHLPNPMDKLRLEMEEKFQIEKQQLLAEFQMERQHMMQLIREELRAEWQRDSDASSTHSYELVER